MAKKAVLVITDDGMPPTVFLVDEENITEEDKAKLEQLCEHLKLSGWDVEDVQEAHDLQQVHDMIAMDFGVREMLLQKPMATVTGRMSSNHQGLSNLPRPGPKLKFDFDYSDLERRVIAAMGPPIMNIYDELVFEVSEKDRPAANEKLKKIFEEWSKDSPPFQVLYGEVARWGCSKANLQELSKTVKTPNGKEIERSWDPCCEGCLGWLHMNDPYEVEPCDECGRWENVTVATVLSDIQELAVKAHKEECGCGWPEFDVQNAAMAWLDDIVTSEKEITEADFKELEAHLNVRGIEFMDGVTPAIYVCSRFLEKDKGANRIAIIGLMKLLKETKEKIDAETLKLKDFGNPPGAEEEEG